MEVLQKLINSNYGEGRTSEITHIVLHHTTGSAFAAWNYFNTSRPSNPTSAHYIVCQNGEVWQCVTDEDTAYHAGSMYWNSISIGIEFESGTDWSNPNSYTEKQLDSGSKLIAHLAIKYKLDIDASTIPHNLISTTQCPGVLNIGLLKSNAKLFFNSKYMPTEDTLRQLWMILRGSRIDLKLTLDTFEKFLEWYDKYGRKECIDKFKYLMRIDAFAHVEIEKIPFENWMINSIEKEYSNKTDLIYATQVFYTQPENYIPAKATQLEYRTFWYVVMPTEEDKLTQFKKSVKPTLNNLNEFFD
jgi:hypothetical protein